MSFLNTLDISASALTAERFRMDMISQNLANIDTTRTAEEGTPYQRRLVVFQERQLSFDSYLQKASQKSQRANTTRARKSDTDDQPASGGGVRVTEVIRDENDFPLEYNPAHPDADEDGYVLKPNVDRAEETIDLMAATHSYNTNITALNVVKTMAMKAAEIMK